MLSCVLLFSFLAIYTRLEAKKSTFSDTFFITVCKKSFLKRAHLLFMSPKISQISEEFSSECAEL